MGLIRIEPFATLDLVGQAPLMDEGGEDDAIAALVSSVPKHVASRGRPDLSWAGSTQLGPDLAAAVREIRDRHEHGPTGTVYLRYGLAEGTPATGDTSTPDRGVGRD